MKKEFLNDPPYLYSDMADKNVSKPSDGVRILPTDTIEYQTNAISLGGSDIQCRPPKFSGNLNEVNTLKGIDGVVLPDNKEAFNYPSTNFSDWPRVENGMLSFRNMDHFYSYFDFLENTSNSAAQQNSGFTQEEFFSSIEQKLGFQSLRQALAHQQNMPQDAKQSHLAREVDFIYDDLFKSFINPERQLAVANYITRFVNNTIAISTAKSRPDLTEFARSLPTYTNIGQISNWINSNAKDVKLEDWYSGKTETEYIFEGNKLVSANTLNSTNNLNRPIGVGNPNLNPVPENPTPDYPNPVLDWRNIDGKILHTNVDTVIDQSGVRVPWVIRDTVISTGFYSDPSFKTTVGTSFINEFFVISTPDLCKDPLRIQIEHLVLRDADVPKKARFEVFWGDSSTYQEFESDTDGYLPPIFHRYDNPGEYRITIKAYTLDLTSVLGIYEDTKFRDIKVPLGCHTGKYKDSGWKDKLRPDTYRKIRGRNWVSNFGYKTRTGARSEAEHYEKNIWGVWTYLPFKKKKNWVVAKYWITYFPEDKCHLPTNFSGEIWQENVSNVEVSHTHSGKIGWFKIISRHELITDDGQPPIILDIETNVC